MTQLLWKGLFSQPGQVENGSLGLPDGASQVKETRSNLGCTFSRALHVHSRHGKNSTHKIPDIGYFAPRVVLYFGDFCVRRAHEPRSRPVIRPSDFSWMVRNVWMQILSLDFFFLATPGNTKGLRLQALMYWHFPIFSSRILGTAPGLSIILFPRIQTLINPINITSGVGQVVGKLNVNVLWAVQRT